LAIQQCLEENKEQVLILVSDFITSNQLESTLSFIAHVLNTTLETIPPIPHISSKATVNQELKFYELQFSIHEFLKL